MKSRFFLSIAAKTLVAFSIATTMQETVASSAAKAKPLKTGTKAPDATLRSQDGNEIKLSAALGGKPTVLIFYRGGWCPYCITHLSELGAIEGDIRKLGYQIIAISPELPAEVANVAYKDHLGYKLYSDSTAEAMKKFGVAFRLDDATFSKYRDSFRVDLEKLSGHSHHILPVPSVFIVDKAGKIIFMHSNPDYKVRLKSADLLSALRTG